MSMRVLLNIFSFDQCLTQQLKVETQHWSGCEGLPRAYLGCGVEQQLRNRGQLCEAAALSWHGVSAQQAAGHVRERL